MRPVPAVPFDDPMNYNHQARRYAETLENAVWTNQVGILNEHYLNII